MSHRLSSPIFKGTILGLAGALSYSLMGISVHLAKGQLPSQELAFFRALISAIILSPFVLKHIPTLFSKRAVIVGIRAVAGTFSILCFFWTLQHGNASTALLLTYLSPPLVIGLSWFFLQERVAVRELFGIGLVLCGSIVANSSNEIGITPSILLIGIVGALCASVAFLSLRQAAALFSGHLIVWTLSIATLIAAPLLPGNWVIPSSQHFQVILEVGVLGLVGQICTTRSFFYLRAPIACTLVLTNLLWTLLIEALFLGPRPSILAYLCFSSIAIGVYLMQTKRSKKDSRSRSTTEMNQITSAA